MATPKDFLEELTAKTLDIKEIKKAASKLVDSPIILRWIENNIQIIDEVSASKICIYLQELSIELIYDNRISNSIVANLYDDYSIIFLICLHCDENKINYNDAYFKMFKNLHIRTEKFNAYLRPNKKLKKIVDANDLLFETYWLIPFFFNRKLLLNIDVEGYIIQARLMANYVEGFGEGYEFFVIGDIKNMDIPAFKEHIREGAIAYRDLKK